MAHRDETSVYGLRLLSRAERTWFADREYYRLGPEADLRPGAERPGITAGLFSL